MKKKEFLEELQKKLYGCNELDAKSIMEYYSEIIDDKMESGMTEEEAVSDVGNVEETLDEFRKKLPAVRKENRIDLDFKDIFMEYVNSDVTICRSEDGTAYIECMENFYNDYEIKCIESILYITQKTEEKWYKKVFQFAAMKSYDLKVFLPSTDFGTLSIDSKRGDVRVKGVHFSKTEIRNLAGDVSVEGIGGDVNIVNTAGDVNIKGGNYGEITAKLTAGDLRIKDGAADRVHAGCAHGDIKVEAFVCNYLKAKTATGDVHLKGTDAFEYNLETVMGDIKGIIITPRRMEVSSVMGDAKAPLYQEASGTLYAKAVMGDIGIKVLRA